MMMQEYSGAHSALIQLKEDLHFFSKYSCIDIDQLLAYISNVYFVGIDAASQTTIDSQLQCNQYNTIRILFVATCTLIVMNGVLYIHYLSCIVKYIQVLSFMTPTIDDCMIYDWSQHDLEKCC